ncbi:hypothetical protein, partial [uncultured Tessaracoccus sp.]|uniref:hypothetical protein n=1 Tax=uncultured Tessaracoccus sp. TaxID=905023 RepID=UPI00261F6ECB
TPVANRRQRQMCIRDSMDVVAHVGFAAFHAKLMHLRECLGLTGLQPTATAQRPWNADERRLAADRPPHWG